MGNKSQGCHASEKSMLLYGWRIGIDYFKIHFKGTASLNRKYSDQEISSIYSPLTEDVLRVSHKDATVNIFVKKKWQEAGLSSYVNIKKFHRNNVCNQEGHLDLICIFLLRMLTPWWKQGTFHSFFTTLLFLNVYSSHLCSKFPFPAILGGILTYTYSCHLVLVLIFSKQLSEAVAGARSLSWRAPRRHQCVEKFHYILPCPRTHLFS